MRQLIAVLALLLATLSGAAAQAQAGAWTALSVSGRIQRTNSADHRSLLFAWADLQRLAQVQVRSITALGGRSEFTGPLLRDILREACAEPAATEVLLTGQDGRQVRVPLSDLVRWDVIAAHSRNGQRLPASEPGPLWVMYPNEEHAAELHNGRIAERQMTALRAIEVR